MDIRNLNTFRHICQLRSFTKTAALLGYTQSAVTMQIKQLEEELNVRLFDRVGKTVHITNEGMRLLKYADEIITAAQNALNDLSSSASPKGILRIGVLESVCTAFLPDVLSDYHRLYPQVTTVIRIGTLAELSPMLGTDFIDLLWTFDRPLDIPEWKKAYVYDNKIEIVCSDKNPLTLKREVNLSDLAAETFILTEQSCSYREIFEERMLALGHRPNIFLEIGNTEMIKKFVEANLGLTVLPNFTVEEEVRAGKLRILNTADFNLQMQCQLFYHKNKWLSPALDAFLKLVMEHY